MFCFIHIINAFVGCDASLAFITGEFNDKGLTDDISSLAPQEIKKLNDWVEFYNKNYIYKGTSNIVHHFIYLQLTYNVKIFLLI